MHKLHKDIVACCSGLREGANLIDAFTADSVDPSIWHSSEDFSTPPSKPVPFAFFLFSVLLFGSGRSRQRRASSRELHMSRGNFVQTLAFSRNFLSPFLDTFISLTAQNPELRSAVKQLGSTKPLRVNLATRLGHCFLEWELVCMRSPKKPPPPSPADGIQALQTPRTTGRVDASALSQRFSLAWGKRGPQRDPSPWPRGPRQGKREKDGARIIMLLGAD